MDFHRLLAKATGNESLLAIQGDFLVRLPPEISTSKEVTRHHEQIVDALEDKDKVKAHRLLEEHLLGIEAQLNRSQKSS
jgi:DNA-binding GntR family transcriptional regulator